MFKSATLRLTGWYLLILMTISILFSITIYQITSNEMPNRLERFQDRLEESQIFFQPPLGIENLREREVNDSLASLSVELLYVNLGVFIIGGLGSYFLAKRSLRPIQKAHEAQSQFTSDASHELRTPLAAMKTELEVALRDKNATVPELKEILSSNLEEVDKLTKLSEMLLNISHLDQNNLKFTSVNINKVLDYIVKDFKESLKRLSVTGSKRLIIHGNEMAITDLMKVLLENAVQYSPPDSKIYIHLSKSEDYAKFEITNSGPGIENDKLPHIFERFYRADSSRTNGSRKGYGLGLALAKNIVELHKGKLFVSSTPGKETTFSFLLPLHKYSKQKIS